MRDANDVDMLGLCFDRSTWDRLNELHMLRLTLAPANHATDLTATLWSLFVMFREECKQGPVRVRRRTYDWTDDRQRKEHDFMTYKQDCSAILQQCRKMRCTPEDLFMMLVHYYYWQRQRDYPKAINWTMKGEN